MRTITRTGRIRHVLASTAGMLAAGSIIAPQAQAGAGDVGDASLWRTSPRCSQPEDILLAAEGSGVLEFEYRVIGAEPTTHEIRRRRHLPPQKDNDPIEERNENR